MFLDFMHTHDVYHRDLNPNNIMIRDDATSAVIDFGSACGYGKAMGSKYQCGAANFQYKFQVYARNDREELRTIDVLYPTVFFRQWWNVRLYETLKNALSEVLKQGQIRMDSSGKLEVVAMQWNNPVSAQDSMRVVNKKMATKIQEWAQSNK